jgi:hypothetical protein
MKINVERRKGAGDCTEYVVTNAEPVPDHRRLDSILTVLTDDAAPTEFGLYVWHAPHGSLNEDWAYRDQVWAEAVEAITGKKVKRAKENSGNGHGVITVEYAEG